MPGKPWDSEMDFRLVMAMLMFKNDGLDFKDWKAAQGTIEKVFKGDKGYDAARQHWPKVRDAFMATLEEVDVKEEAKDDTAGSAAPKPKRRVRAPKRKVDSDDEQLDDVDDEDAETGRPAPKKRARRAITKDKKVQYAEEEDDEI
ncbi:hypothetical protein PG984_008971 [Apiospora sp. TS-2023a]